MSSKIKIKSADEQIATSCRGDCGSKSHALLSHIDCIVALLRKFKFGFAWLIFPGGQLVENNIKEFKKY